MIEIVILVILCGKIGRIVEQKGRKKTGYQFMLVGLWIAGEVLGGLLGLIVSQVADMEDAGSLLVLAFAVGGIITGATIAFRIAKNVPPLESDEEYYRDLDHLDNLQAGEHFHPRSSATSAADDGYVEKPETPPRPADPRIQE